MKIEIKQLYTALQYYKMLQKERLFIHPDEPDGGMSECADNWVHYGDYLRLLDQPLTKEMFINPLEEPTDMFQGEQYYGSMMDSFQEAEKKVILDGWSERKWNGGVVYDNDELDVFIDLEEYSLLSDLAEGFNGKLKLKNVEI